VSLNYRDLLTVEGQYNPNQPLPLVPCSDGAGEVVAVGEGVTRFQEGDRACAIFAQEWLAGRPTHERLRSTLGGPLSGTLSERIVLNQNGLVKTPDYLSDLEASTLACAGLTAWSALSTYGDVSAGDTVLILGTGGVAVFALQICRMLGARAIITSSSPEKLGRARELGAWETINYKADSKWHKTVRKLTSGAGVDHVMELGGAGTLAQSLQATRLGGQVSVIGTVTGVVGSVNIVPILMGQIQVQGILVGHRDGFENMNRAFGAHRVKPVIDRVFRWKNAVQAFHYLQAGSHFGKICVELPV
jgi:NADPH:quinone reductase-like Zn-dependent oxidoreductase